MTLRAYTDGAARGNPGDAGIGVLVKASDDTVILSAHGYIGTATNNVAEYTALLHLLETSRTFSCTRLVVHSDSELMVRQITGRYRVRDAGLKHYHRRVMELMARSPFPVEVRHIRREDNGEADQLANLGIDSRKRITV
jgi:ribonuclease HI